MVGRWYGNQPTTDGGRKEWVVERDVRGTYEIRFLIREKDGAVEESTEIGEWGISGGVYFSIFKGWVQDGKIKASDPTDPFSYDAYKIISLKSKAFTYESFISGEKFTVINVSDNFSLDPAFSKP